MKTYKETVDWLFQQFPSYQNIGANAYKPSLDNIFKLCDAFNNPQNELKFIHVAGTNGKGSTCSMLASILTESNYKVGLFTSPHIQDYTERIRINGVQIKEDFVVKSCNDIKQADIDFEPSFFEISFLLALLYFKENECDICVIETGLGGRLDATNIIQPMISLITNISIEHTQFLGDTVVQIAREKAGIIKNNTPCIVGEFDKNTAPVFIEIAQSKNSPLIFADSESLEIPKDFPLLGAYQTRNFKLVDVALSKLTDLLPISNNAKSDGLKNLRENTGFYGRMQIVSNDPMTIFDVSHNVAGISETLKTISTYKHSLLHIVYGTSSDKNFHEIGALFPANAHYYFTEFSNVRSANQSQLKDLSDKYQLNSIFFSNPKEALKKAQTIANKEDIILVFGSFFLLSDIF